MVDNVTPTENDTLVQAEPVKDTGTSADGIGGGPRSTADRLREEAGKLGSQAADRARTFAGEGKDKASSALDEVAKMMASAANDVDERLGADYGKYARSAADGIASFSESLRGKQVDELLDDAAAFVRKSPVIAVGTAAAIGFVLARLIKSGVDAAADLADRDDSKPDADSPKA